MGRVSKYLKQGVKWSHKNKCYVVVLIPEKGGLKYSYYTMDQDEALTVKLEHAEKRRLKEGSEAAELIDDRERRTLYHYHEFYTEEEFEELITEETLCSMSPLLDHQDLAMRSTLRMCGAVRRPPRLDRGALQHIENVSK
jgi:hypothetical protein